MVVCRLRHLCWVALPSLPTSLTRRPHSGAAVPFISLGRHFRLIGTYNQFFIPRNQVTSVSASLPLFCAIANTHFSLPVSRLQYLLVATSDLPRLFFPFPRLTMLSLELHLRPYTL